MVMVSDGDGGDDDDPYARYLNHMRALLLLMLVATRLLEYRCDLLPSALSCASQYRSILVDDAEDTKAQEAQEALQNAEVGLCKPQESCAARRILIKIIVHSEGSLQ
eukprot:3150306-Amphidinium_carterae.1